MIRNVSKTLATVSASGLCIRGCDERLAFATRPKSPSSCVFNNEKKTFGLVKTEQEKSWISWMANITGLAYKFLVSPLCIQLIVPTMHVIKHMIIKMLL